MKMSVSRALNELTLLDKKITSNVNNITAALPYVNQENPKFTAGFESKDDATRHMSRVLDQVTSWKNRHRAIKSAVILSNATTKLKVADVEMTVAEAIERKSSIEYDALIAKRLHVTYANCRDQIERVNESKMEKARAAAAQVCGSDDTSSENFQSILETMFTREKLHMCVIRSEQDIQDMLNAVEDFKSEVDSALNESNVTTMIEVPDA